MSNNKQECRGFFFLPFICEEKDVKDMSLTEALSNCDGVRKDKYEAPIFYKYVAGDLYNTNEKKRCQKYILLKNSVFMKFFRKEGKKIKYRITDPFTAGKENLETVEFEIENAYIMTYGNSVNFFVYEIVFDVKEHTIRELSNTIYFLKKPYSSRNSIIKVSDNKTNEEKTSLGNIAEEILKEISPRNYEVLFYIQDKKHGRVNYLLMLSTDSRNLPEENISRQLFYLKNGFSEKYFYSDEMDVEKNYYGPNWRMWGISSEASVCIVKDVDNRKILKKLFNEFEEGYFYMFSLLLFQKYTYFYYLSYLTEGYKTKNLKVYAKELEEFERKYMFSVISDIPQYKAVYELMVKYFDLDKLYDDVHEPVNELISRQQRKRDLVLTVSGVAISVIGIIFVVLDYIKTL